VDAAAEKVAPAAVRDRVCPDAGVLVPVAAARDDVVGIGIRHQGDPRRRGYLADRRAVLQNPQVAPGGKVSTKISTKFGGGSTQALSDIVAATNSSHLRILPLRPQPGPDRERQGSTTFPHCDQQRSPRASVFDAPANGLRATACR